jgi:hypothetical protein
MHAHDQKAPHAAQREGRSQLTHEAEDQHEHSPWGGKGSGGGGGGDGEDEEEGEAEETGQDGSEHDERTLEEGSEGILGRHCSEPTKNQAGRLWKRGLSHPTTVGRRRRTTIAR